MMSIILARAVEPMQKQISLTDFSSTSLAYKRNIMECENTGVFLHTGLSAQRNIHRRQTESTILPTLLALILVLF